MQRKLFRIVQRRWQKCHFPMTPHDTFVCHFQHLTPNTQLLQNKLSTPKTCSEVTKLSLLWGPTGIYSLKTIIAFDLFVLVHRILQIFHWHNYKQTIHMYNYPSNNVFITNLYIFLSVEPMCRQLLKTLHDSQSNML